jgi:hypothetical protein
MSWIQFEVWGLLDGHEELLETTGTLKEAEKIAEDLLEFNEAVWILQDTDGDLKEVRRYRGLL